MESSAAEPARSHLTFAAHIGDASTAHAALARGVLSLLTKWDEKSMTDTTLLVSVVDDDESVRESLPDLLKDLGFAAHTFSSAQEFLESPTGLKSRCLLLDIAMPGISGPELQLELKRRGIHIPVIFITAQRNEAVRRRLLEQGAVGCLLKPFSDSSLRDALNAALRVE